MMRPAQVLDQQGGVLLIPATGIYDREGLASVTSLRRQGGHRSAVKAAAQEDAATVIPLLGHGAGQGRPQHRGPFRIIHTRLKPDPG